MSERSRRPMGGGHGMRSVEKAKDFKGAMSRLFQYMGCLLYTSDAADEL